ncbi:MAG: SAM-dependent chlorinase/fluorinase [Chromatiaceae bacterium]|nr:SAM-dependent chlorinase/fluorinase [Chromatiaceae bacterium]
MAGYSRIALLTDFGAASPYVGQLRLCLAAALPGISIIEVISDLPAFRPDLAAYLLPALVRDLPRGTLYLCVVDPGVGGDRLAIAVEADGNYFIGPDNGLLALVCRGALSFSVFRIDWRPEILSPSFQGRDLFAPVAISLTLGRPLAMTPFDPDRLQGAKWPNDLPRVIYQDSFGNLITGIRAALVQPGGMMDVRGQRVPRARTFNEVPHGTAFWYENAFGLVEIAVNQGSAALKLGLEVGDEIAMGLFR